jgi:hypothetical protein
MISQYVVETNGNRHQLKASHRAITPSAINDATAPPASAPATRLAIARVKYVTTTKAAKYRPVINIICCVVILIVTMSLCRI